MAEEPFDSEVTMAGDERALLAGRYRIVRRLGQGGMGSVWLAEDTQLDNKRFAIKMLPSILVANRKAYRQLKDEALVAMKLVHPNIVQIRAFEENGGNPFIVMDYIEGEPLDSCLEDWGNLTDGEAAKLLGPIASALDYAHTQGVVHRDIKPGNIIVRTDGTPFILDFGIAREMQETMTRVTGKLSSGTLLYMSPEQLRGQAPKPAQDVYSFAAMVYECIKGDPPFSRGQVEYQILNEKPEPLPAGLKRGAAIMRGLAKNPEERPRTCVEILKATAPVRAMPNVPAASAKRMPQTVPVKSGSKVVPVLLLVGFLIVLAVAGNAWRVSYRKQQELQRQAAAEQRAAAERAANEKHAEEERQKSADEERRRKEDEARRREEEQDRLAKKSATEIRVEASVQRDKVGHISDTDGFKERKVAMDDIFTRAEKFYDASVANWSKAESLYREYIAQSIELLSLDGHRQTAMNKRAEAQNAFRKAEAAGAKEYAVKSWNEAVAIWSNASSELRQMFFGDATRTFARAAEAFDACATEAEKEKARRERKYDATQKFIKAMEEGDYHVAAQLVAEVDQSDSLVQCYIGSMYFLGKGLVKNYSEALRLYRLSADQGNAMAQSYLGSMYMNGWGVAKNYSEAVRLFRLSANQGNANGQLLLGAMYERGWGVAKDYSEALRLYRLSADQGHAAAQNNLGTMYSDGNGVAKDYSEAVRWFRLAADQGDAMAQSNLGSMYMNGWGVAKNYSEAVRLFRLSANQGNANGQLLLGAMYERGWGVAKDYSEALRLYRLSADQGYAHAQNNLGYMYMNGNGVSKNYSEAVRWFRLAAEQGDADAQNNLGYMYENGFGVAQNRYEAVRLYRMAANQGEESAISNLRRLGERW